MKQIRSNKGLSFVVAILLGVFGVSGAGLVINRWLATPQNSVTADLSVTEKQVAGEQPTGEQGTNPGVEVSQPKISAPATLTQAKNGAIANASNAGNKAEATAIATRQGLLRIGNLSDHPIRVALLIKKPTVAQNGATAATAYEAPAHWDFDPGEGSTKGLIVSLPNRKIKLKKGDVLVAFAQDGSRQYWGPYVVGETSSPVWSPKAAEWELIVEP